MSLILDALKKADVKRSQSPPDEQVAPATTNIVDSKDAINAERLKQLAAANWGMLCVSIFLSVLVVVLVFFLLGTEDENTKSRQSHEANSRKIIRDNPSSMPALKAQNDIDSLYQTNKVEAQPESRGIKELYNDRTTHEFSTPVATQLPALRAPPSSNVEVTPGEFSSVKNLKEMPPAFQDAIPTLMYTQHIYEKNGTSLVVMNKRKYFVGEQVVAQVEIVDILAQEIVLKKNGQLFKLNARNSWINF